VFDKPHHSLTAAGYHLTNGCGSCCWTCEHSYAPEPGELVCHAAYPPWSVGVVGTGCCRLHERNRPAWPAVTALVTAANRGMARDSQAFHDLLASAEAETGHSIRLTRLTSWLASWPGHRLRVLFDGVEFVEYLRAV